jgi:hypothetical protein
MSKVLPSFAEAVGRADVRRSRTNSAEVHASNDDRPIVTDEAERVTAVAIDDPCRGIPQTCVQERNPVLAGLPVRRAREAESLRHENA